MLTQVKHMKNVCFHWDIPVVQTSKLLYMDLCYLLASLVLDLKLNLHWRVVHMDTDMFSFPFITNW